MKSQSTIKLDSTSTFSISRFAIRPFKIIFKFTNSRGN